MRKKQNKNFVLRLVILWVLAYVCFAFVLAELNPFKWEQLIRSGYVFTMLSMIVLLYDFDQF